MKLYFAGGEVPTWRKLLISEHVPHVAVNYLHLKPRITKRPWLLAERFPPEVSIFVDSGAAGTGRKHWVSDQHEEYLAEYRDFVHDNLDRIAYFTEYDATSMGLDWIDGHRMRTWAALAPEKFVPIWHEEWDPALLRTMVEFFPNLGVPPLSEQAQNALGGLVRRTRRTVHGLGFAHPHDAPGGLYDTIVSSSWISPMRFGETQVWDTNRLRRFPAEDKEKVRRRYRSKFIQAGFDAAKIQADDSHEIARYTVWAWRQLEATLMPPERAKQGQRVTLGNGHRDPEIGEDDSAPVAIEPEAPPGNGSRLPAVLKPLPVFDFRPVKAEVPSPDGLGSVEVVTDVAVMGRGGLRQCASCSLAAVCPEFDAGSSCRFEIPVEIRNRQQLMSVLHSLLEMQSQRIAFGFFAEQLQGAYPDANLSAELDRMMRMTAAVKDIQDNRDFLKVTVEGRAQSGVLRRLFGSERAETLHQVDGDRAEQAVRRTMGS